jgi:thiol-disulfide isomerase/thioredoxin
MTSNKKHLKCDTSSKEMSQIQQLTTGDYTIYEHQDADKTRNLVISVKDPAIVLYYSTSCPHCRVFMPIFEQIATNAPRFRFCILNAERYKNVAISSMTTTTPIRSVPHILAYNKGKPVATYSGPRNYNDILDFLRTLSSQLEKMKFNRRSPDASAGRASATGVPTGNKEDILSYKSDLGIPYNIVCGDGQCHLTFEQIYGGGSADTVPDSCYLTFSECYGQDCKTDIQNPRARIAPQSSAAAARSASGMGGGDVGALLRSINL